MNNKIKKQKGFALVENLVSISLVSIAMVGLTSLVITSVNANNSSRDYVAVVSDVNSIVDNYRNLSYQQLLNKFGSNPTSINDGQTIVENSSGQHSKSEYQVNLVALKSGIVSTPEAIQIRVNATQRRGIFGDQQFTFETLLAPTS